MQWKYFTIKSNWVVAWVTSRVIVPGFYSGFFDHTALCVIIYWKGLGGETGQLNSNIVHKERNAISEYF